MFDPILDPLGPHARAPDLFYSNDEDPDTVFSGIIKNVTGVLCHIGLLLWGLILWFVRWIQNMFSTTNNPDVEQPCFLEKTQGFQRPGFTFVPFYTDFQEDLTDNERLDKLLEFHAPSRFSLGQSPVSPSILSLILKGTLEYPSSATIIDCDTLSQSDIASSSSNYAASPALDEVRPSVPKTAKYLDSRTYTIGDYWPRILEISEKSSMANRYLAPSKCKENVQPRKSIELVCVFRNYNGIFIYVCFSQNNEGKKGEIQLYYSKDGQELFKFNITNGSFRDMSGLETVSSTQLSFKTLPQAFSDKHHKILSAKGFHFWKNAYWTHPKHSKSGLSNLLAAWQFKSFDSSDTTPKAKTISKSTPKIELATIFCGLVIPESPPLISKISDTDTSDLHYENSETHRRATLQTEMTETNEMEDSEIFLSSGETLATPEFFDEELMQLSDEELAGYPSDFNSLWSILGLGRDYENEWIVDENYDGRDIAVLCDLNESLPDLRRLTFITIVRANLMNNSSEILDERPKTISFDSDESNYPNAVEPKSVVYFNIDDVPQMISRCSGDSSVATKSILKKPKILNERISIEPRVFKQPLGDQDLRNLEVQLWERLRECAQLTHSLEAKHNLWDLREVLGHFYDSFEFARMRFAEVATSQIFGYMYRLGELRKVGELAANLMRGAGNQYSNLLVIIRLAKITENAVVTVENSIGGILEVLSEVGRLLGELQKAISDMKDDFNDFVPAMSRMGSVALSIGFDLSQLYDSFCDTNVEDYIERLVIDKLTGYLKFMDEMTFLRKNKDIDFEDSYDDALGKLQTSHDIIDTAKEAIGRNARDILRGLRLVRLDLVLENDGLMPPKTTPDIHLQRVTGSELQIRTKRP
ncbi:hypothetical protein METBIDRAFT_228278 [Metschnikowia bicuspidata var. bicuspidata NRRL YB-4993]|uniref:Uncharacterized protein n=1 Tax=Metschnikowia bicuspidata var. bicuspidata NRRL YB-4993 TaxID=869754 RepID=A0A1A0HG74_9ASCO|nr:hypothetical protein METBIDRAFT_228278 [Metschnikowia bicuspidata var. bicuspidata NRRL YB-4993]OBA22990.1 hypothetical protein METBIDRAFT_228278 [Metschnikowia bicuspidata var. bicuspidata NRRL YB-4993]